MHNCAEVSLINQSLQAVVRSFTANTWAGFSSFYFYYDYPGFYQMCLYTPAVVPDFYNEMKRHCRLALGQFSCMEKKDSVLIFSWLWLSESSCRAKESGNMRAADSLAWSFMISVAAIYCSTKKYFRC